MDDLNCSGKVVDRTLRELDFINKWLGGDQVTLDAVDKLLATAAKLGDSGAHHRAASEIAKLI